MLYKFERIKGLPYDVYLHTPEGWDFIKECTTKLSAKYLVQYLNSILMKVAKTRNKGGK